MNLVRRIILFAKNEIVLCVATILAVVSSFIVTPGREYIDYIDFRTLGLLFCLMAVVAGWQKGWAFEHIAGTVLGKVRNTRQLVYILVLMCFFSSMLITNDVALITFVPFCCLILHKAGHNELIIYTVVLQTIAANLGSMLLPIGNPQNLYLFGEADYGFVEFVRHMLPIWLVSFVLIIFSVLPIKKKDILVEKSEMPDMKNGLMYLLLFALCLTTVAGYLNILALTVIVFVAVLIFDRQVLFKVDYLLLLTFTFFFIFIGNLKNIPEVADVLSEIIVGREMVVGVAASQLTSNVPAAILLRGFTGDIKVLLWGTNIGGLGTLIASMASLISYKIYQQQDNHDTKKYFLVFTGMNVLFLIILLPIALLIL